MRKLINFVESHELELANLAAFGTFALSIIVSVKYLRAIQELVKKVRVIYDVQRYTTPHYFCEH